MAKTNFTKVEEALSEGIRKIEVNRLLIIADENAAANASKSEDEQLGTETGKAKPAPPKVDAANLQRLTTVHHELKALDKLGEQPYARLGIDKDEIKKFMKNPVVLTEDDWEKVKAIKEQIAAYKQERQMPGTDDELITQQRKNQKTKRFNISSKWIPLR